MKRDFDVASDWAASWNGSIAIKVTAVTIWIILVLSFVMTIPFVSSFEESSKKKYSWQRLQTEEFIHRNSVNKTSRDKMFAGLDAFLSDTDIQYLAFNYLGEDVSYGVSSEDSYKIGRAHV